MATDDEKSAKQAEVVTKKKMPKLTNLSGVLNKRAHEEGVQLVTNPVEMRKLNKETVPLIVDRFMAMDREELARIANDPKTPAIELILIKVITEAIKSGDHQRLGFLFDRIMGKQPDHVTITGVHLSIVRALQQIEDKANNT